MQRAAAGQSLSNFYFPLPLSRKGSGVLCGQSEILRFKALREGRLGTAWNHSGVRPPLAVYTQYPLSYVQAVLWGLTIAGDCARPLSVQATGPLSSCPRRSLQPTMASAAHNPSLTITGAQGAGSGAFPAGGPAPPSHSPGTTHSHTA